jgi:riboflavin biosynthesis pyrimidine reductase
MDEARVRLFRCAGLPIQGELHARQLLLRKGRYHELRIRSQAVLTIIRTIDELAASPEIRIHSEVLQKSAGVQSLRAVLRAQMLRNTRTNIAISDRGRVPRMRHIIRMELGRGAIPLPPIEGMLEIESRDCAMVQLADFFATAAYLRASAEIGCPHHARMNQAEAAAMIMTTEGANRTYRLVRPDGTA